MKFQFKIFSCRKIFETLSSLKKKLVKSFIKAFNLNINFEAPMFLGRDDLELIKRDLVAHFNSFLFHHNSVSLSDLQRDVILW